MRNFMGKKIYLVLFLFILILEFADAKSLTVNPAVIDKTYYLGSNQLQTASLTFSNNDNSSFDLTLSKSGGSSNFISLSTTTLNFSGVGSKNINVNFNIPQNTQIGLYSGAINYDAGQDIPVYINVLRNSTTGCRFIIPFTDYEYIVKSGTQPSSQDFLVKVSSECTSGILLTELRTTGVILTDNGNEPIRLTGGLPTNQQFNADSTFTFSLQTDVNKLSTGVYTSFVVMSGISGNDIVTATLRFKTTVSGSASPVGDVITPPIFDKLPDDLTFNQTYELTARNVDPNLQLFVEPNENIYGVNVIIQENNWKYVFRPAKSGNTIIKAYATYKGGIIGGIYSQEVRILVGGPAISGTNLTLEFYPNSSLWLPNAQISILVKDAKTGNIVSNPTIFVNGVPTTTNQFTIGSSINYKISVTALGYNTVEKEIHLTPQLIKIQLNPGDTVDLNTNVTIITDPNDATVNINGLSSSKSFIVNREGSYIIVANKEGYLDNNITLLVKKFPAAVLNQPSEIKKGKNVTIELTKEDAWSAFYRKTLNEPKKLITTQTSKTVSFPVKFGSGFYSIEINNQQIWEQEVKGNNILTSLPNWVYIIIIIAVLFLIVILFVSSKGKGKRSEGSGDEGLKYGFEVET